MAKAKRQQSKSNPGCFSGFIRLLLCTGKVPTHPSSSPILDTTETKIPKPEPGPESKPGPNLVARLMGLDSLPPSINFPQKNPSPDSFSRSRSVNFVDYLLKFDPNNDSQSQSQSHSLSHHHRRVRTSVSFREVPSGEFVVVYLDDDDHSVNPEKEKFIKKKKTSKNDNENEKKKRTKNDNESEKKKKKIDNKISKLKNEPRSRSKVLLPKGKGKSGNDGAKVLAKTDNNGDVKPKVLKKEISEKKKVTETFSRKRRNQKIVRSVENKAQNLSSVSVLEEKHSTPVNLESKTKTKSEPKTSYHCNDQFELRSIEKQTNGNNRTDNNDTLDFSKLAEQLLKITKEDLNESYWISNNSNNIRDFEDIFTEFERLILDVLLNEVTSEIAQIY